MENKERPKGCKDHFPIKAHRERKLPGGEMWIYVPWQIMRDRLDEVDPNWSVEFFDPVICGELTVMRCQLTVCGVSRQGVGNADPNKKGFGSVVELARADAFKEALEMFGVGAYLDDQLGTRAWLEQHGGIKTQFRPKQKGEISKEEWLTRTRGEG